VKKPNIPMTSKTQWFLDKQGTRTVPLLWPLGKYIAAVFCRLILDLNAWQENHVLDDTYYSMSFSFHAFRSGINCMEAPAPIVKSRPHTI
jgi:hypothetical protein